MKVPHDDLYDKSKLPAELILTNDFRVGEGKIVELFIVHNTPPAYWTTYM